MVCRVEARCRFSPEKLREKAALLFVETLSKRNSNKGWKSA